jgi:hypothetical protein
MKWMEQAMWSLMTLAHAIQSRQSSLLLADLYGVDGCLAQ